ERHDEGRLRGHAGDRQACDLERDPHRAGRQWADRRALGPCRSAGSIRPTRHRPRARTGSRRGLVATTLAFWSEAPRSMRGASLASLLWSWLGRKDSNLRSPDPESGALPLGHTPAGAPWHGTKGPISSPI